VNSFILRILFNGLIAFIPSDNGQEVTVLLLNVDHAYHTSDGAALSQHKPLLLARAGNCTGDCSTNDSDIAEFIYADKTNTLAVSSLEAALAGGGAWDLTGADLSVQKVGTNANLPSLVVRDNVRGTTNNQPQIIPTTSTERGDFSWIADMQQICPSGCTLNSDVLDAVPPPGLVAARFRIRSGEVFTYAVARMGSDVTPVHFSRLDGTGSPSAYTQAIATWVGVDIAVSGDSIELVDERLDSGTNRSMVLEPDSNDKVEIAVLNLPPFVPPASSTNGAPQVGKHFEAYYELMETPPAKEARLVPRAGAAPGTGSYAEVDWSDIHPTEEVYSELLNALRLDAGRSAYDRVLCPPFKP
jgi:hypothetical protein